MKAGRGTRWPQSEKIIKIGDTSICSSIHENNSTKILNHFGAENSPNGRYVLMYGCLCHLMASKLGSADELGEGKMHS